METRAVAEIGTGMGTGTEVEMGTGTRIERKRGRRGAQISATSGKKQNGIPGTGIPHVLSSLLTGGGACR